MSLAVPLVVWDRSSKNCAMVVVELSSIVSPKMLWKTTLVNSEEKVHPAILQRMLSYMEEAHEPHPNWPTPRQKK